MDRQTAVMVVLATCAFASGFGMRVADPIIPMLGDEFGTSLTTTSLLVTAFALCYALGQPILGPLGDVFGKARMVIFCGASAALLVCACALASGFGALAGLRAASGFVAGGIVPLSLALVSDRVAAERRQAAIGRFIMAPILGQMLGAAFSGVVAERLGWRPVFALTGLLLAAATAVTFAVVGIRRRSAAEPFALSTMFRRYGQVFAGARAAKLYALVMGLGVATYGIFPFIAAILQARLGTGATEAGLAIAGFGIGGLTYGVLVAQVVRWLGPARMSVTGGIVAGCAMVAFAWPPHWMLVVAVFAVMGFFFGMLHNTLAMQATELAPEARGTAISLFAFAMFTAQGLGPLAIGPALSVVPLIVIVIVLGSCVATVGILARLLVIAPGPGA